MCESVARDVGQLDVLVVDLLLDVMWRRWDAELEVEEQNVKEGIVRAELFKAIVWLRSNRTYVILTNYYNIKNN